MNEESKQPKKGLAERLKDPSNLPITTAIETISGEPFFKEEDLNGVTDVLVIVLRSVLMSLGVTKEQFAAKHKELCEAAGFSQKDIAGKRNNLLNVIKRDDKISWSKLYEILFTVLQYSLKDISIVIGDEKGNEMRYSLDEVRKNRLLGK
jgi:hypothetical protein